MKNDHTVSGVANFVRNLRNFHVVDYPTTNKMKEEFGRRVRGYTKNTYKAFEELPSDASNDAGIFIEIEKIEAQRMAAYLLENKQLPNQEGLKIPILYGADSGIHTADGMARGIEWYSDTKPEIYTYIRDCYVPAQALELAKKCGVIMFCDSEVEGGGTVASFLQHIPPQDPPLKVVIYANHGHGTKMEFFDNYALYATSNIKEGFRKDLDVHAYFSNISGQKADHCDRADLIAATEHPHTEGMHARLVNRKSPFKDTPPKDYGVER